MTKLRAEQRRAQILSKATRLARDGLLYNMTADDVAEAVGVKRPTVLHYFKSMQGLRDEVVLTAIKEENLDVIAQALAANDPLTDGIDIDLRQRAALTLA